MLDQYAGLAITLSGILLIVASAIAIVLNLLADVLKAFQQTPPTGLNSVAGFKDWLEKLPERYFVPVVMQIFGILLAAPAKFAEITRTLFPPAA